MFSSSLVLTLLLTSVSAETDINCTISVPGFSHHGDCNLLCRPATWTDFFAFYVGNYLAHAATINTKPGQSTASSILTLVFALFFPTSGVVAGVSAIWTRAIFAPTSLRTAARAGALCMVVKRSGCEIEPNSKVQNRLTSTSIHTRCVLPKGYSLMMVPPSAEFEDDNENKASFWQKTRRQFKPDTHPNVAVSCSYNVIKILVAIGQVLYATSTLYSTRGNQISRYGYAAFGLTVAPYAWMSLINLLGNLVCPKYNSMYLVDSNTLLELRTALSDCDRTAQFPIGSTIAKLTLESEQEALETWKKMGLLPIDIYARFLRRPYTDKYQDVMVTVFGVAVPLAIYGGLSGFDPGSSTHTQRVWTMLWLCFGMFVGLTPWPELLEGRPLINHIPVYSQDMREGPIHHVSQWFSDWRLSVIAYLLVMVLTYGIPPVGGFVTVGLMIREYGTCLEIS